MFARVVGKVTALKRRRYVTGRLIVPIDGWTNGTEVNSTVPNIRDRQRSYIKNI
jgi:hypothetical protein